MSIKSKRKREYRIFDAALQKEGVPKTMIGLRDTLF